MNSSNRMHGIDYGNEKLNQLFDLTWPNLNRMTEPYPDEMFEEAERREAENRALNALDKLYEDNCAALEILHEIERKEQIDSDNVS